MTSASAAPVGLARQRADAVPRRVVAGRAEWLTLSSLAAFREEWRDLSCRALEPNVFYDPAFALAAAPVFGADVGAIVVWSRIRPVRLIGLFPARIERRYGVMTALTGWTHPYAPFGAPLTDRDETEAAIVAFLDHVEVDTRLPGLILLPLIAAEGPFADILARVLARHGGRAERFGEHARALLAPTAERLGYLDHAISAKKLKELRRQRRRLLDKGQLKTVSAHEPDEIPRGLSDHLALEAQGWKGRAGSAARQHAPVRAFMETALAALAAQGGVRIDRLMQNNHPLASAITLRSGHCAWFWKIAYDEDVARFSPGVQISLDLTEALLAEPEIACADSCATADHPMIDHLWRERLALNDLLIAPSAAALAQLRVARPLETLRRTLIATAKRARNTLKPG
jgi:CelD/BcsL family acetyltransferase involved in cellulose biosynthesis